MKDLLYDEYKWIMDTKMPLVDVVRKILSEEEDDEEETNVFNSSIWAVCMAYLDYKEGTEQLTVEEHRYARSRGGVIGMQFQPVIEFFTLREYLETRDPGFAYFSTPPHLRKPSGA